MLTLPSPVKSAGQSRSGQSEDMGSSRLSAAPKSPRRNAPTAAETSVPPASLRAARIFTAASTACVALLLLAAGSAGASCHLAT